MEQRTKEWYAARLGKLTASRLSDALDITKKGEEGAKRQNYRLELLAERFTGLPVEFFETAAMRWGTDCEPLARAAYEAETGNLVTEVGFIDHPSLEWAGASPDGLVGDDGLLEIKCPTTQSHIKYLLGGVAPDQYKNQMAWQIICTGRKWCDFVSYDPRMTEGLQLLIVRYEPSAEELLDISIKATAFLETVAQMQALIEAYGIEHYRKEKA